MITKRCIKSENTPIGQACWELPDESIYVHRLQHETKSLDCVIIGYWEKDWNGDIENAKTVSKFSGAYEEIKLNSILYENRRISYEEFFNQSLAIATRKNWNLSAFNAPNLAVCYLTDFLRRLGHNVEFVNFVNHHMDKFKHLLSKTPRCVALTTTYYVDHQVLVDLVEMIRRSSPTTKIVLGGPFIYSLVSRESQEVQDFILSEIKADIYILDGQGETTLGNVVESLKTTNGDISTVPNLAIRKEKVIHRTPVLPENNNLNNNSIRWKAFDKDFLGRVVYLRTSRGCPFSCSFCTYHINGGKFEQMALSTLEMEMRALCEQGVTHLMFVDDTFNVPASRFIEICKMMKRNRFRFKWISYFRCGHVSEEIFDLMQESGCTGVILGIESGDQSVLDIMNKGVKVEQLGWSIEQLNKRGIATAASLFVGFPGETEQSVNNTIKFLNETKPTFQMVQLYYHYDYTPINRRASEFSIKGAGYSWSHKTMNWKRAAELVRKVYTSVPGSIITPLRRFDLWTMQYWESLGFRRETLMQFLKIAQEMLLATLDEQQPNFSAQQNRLASLFSGTDTRTALSRLNSLQ